MILLTINMWYVGQWSSDQSTWLQIQGARFDSRLYQIFWEVVSQVRGPLSLVSTIEELLGRKSSGSGLENLEHGRRDPSRWPRGTLCPQTSSLASQLSGGLSVGIVRSLTQATEFFNIMYLCLSCIYSTAEYPTCPVAVLFLQVFVVLAT
jgi:hypothetical protein